MASDPTRGNSPDFPSTRPGQHCFLVMRKLLLSDAGCMAGCAIPEPERSLG